MNEGEAGRHATPTVGDLILGGRLVLRQFRRGHRAGTDAVLLAAATRLEPGERLVDVGAGVGTVGLALALRRGDVEGTLLEQDPALAALAADNCVSNGLDGRLAVACCNLFDAKARRAAGLEEGRASLVVTNPPFYAGREARRPIDPGKARAYHLGDATRPRDHADWIHAASALLAPGGRFHAIHRPEALPALIAACVGRLGGIAILPVHPRAEAAAIRILLSARKGSRAPLRLLPPLVLHDDAGTFTPLAEALHRGEASIDMGGGPGTRAAPSGQ